MLCISYLNLGSTFGFRLKLYQEQLLPYEMLSSISTTTGHLCATFSSTDNVHIKFFELDENDREVWKAYGEFADADVHHQYAIVFRWVIRLFVGRVGGGFHEAMAET